MSDRMVRLWVSMVVLILAWGPSSADHARATAYVGALGDSLTDEYFEQDLPMLSPPIRQYDYAKGWLELIVTSGKADGGLFASGSWGEPRRTGYEYNFARWGAVSEDLTGQVDAMQDVFTPFPPGIGSDNHFVGLCIGANDFFPGVSSSSNYYNWKASFGPEGNGATSASIPEPPSLALAMLIGLIFPIFSGKHILKLSTSQFPRSPTWGGAISRPGTDVFNR